MFFHREKTNEEVQITNWHAVGEVYTWYYHYDSYWKPQKPLITQVVIFKQNLNPFIFYKMYKNDVFTRNIEMVWTMLCEKLLFFWKIKSKAGIWDSPFAAAGVRRLSSESRITSLVTSWGLVVNLLCFSPEMRIGQVLIQRQNISKPAKFLCFFSMCCTNSLFESHLKRST